MCGRFALTINPALLARLFNLETIPDIQPRYNIAPSQTIAAVVQNEDTPKRRLAMLQWGLIPHWSKDPAIGNKLINARSETVYEKPSFREAFKSRRCLIPADGFYEWQKTGKNRRPWVFRPREKECLALAGLWEHWDGPDANIDSCTILTTAANDSMQPIHHRMPVIIRPDDFHTWLDPAERSLEKLQPLFQPVPPDYLLAYPVNHVVNRAGHNDPLCLQPAADIAGEDEKTLF